MIDQDLYFPPWNMWMMGKHIRSILAKSEADSTVLSSSINALDNMVMCWSLVTTKQDSALSRNYVKIDYHCALTYKPILNEKRAWLNNYTHSLYDVINLI